MWLNTWMVNGSLSHNFATANIYGLGPLFLVVLVERSIVEWLIMNNWTQLSLYFYYHIWIISRPNYHQEFFFAYCLYRLRIWISKIHYDVVVIWIVRFRERNNFKFHCLNLTVLTSTTPYNICRGSKHVD